VEMIIIAPYCSFSCEGNEGRFETLANIAVQQGIKVKIYTSNFGHKIKDFRKINNNFTFEVCFIPELGYKKNLSVRRILSHTYWLIRCILEVVKNNDMKSSNIFYCAAPFYSITNILNFFKIWCKFKTIIDIQDEWPRAFEMALPHRMHIFLRPLYYLTYLSFKYCDAIIAVSNEYMRNALKCVPTKKNLVVYLGVPNFVIQPEKTKEVVLPSKNISFYIGTLGASYDIETVVKAFNDERLKSRGHYLNIYGDGPDLEYLKGIAGERIKFMGTLSRQNLLSEIGKLDFAINPIKKGAPQSITNKLADYIVIGKPIVSSQHSEEFDCIMQGEPLIKYEPHNVESLIYAMKSAEYMKNHQINQSKMDLFIRRKTYTEIIDFIMELKFKNL
jgi:glycosyltransferase involved in cell wall biosynthesis